MTVCVAARFPWGDMKEQASGVGYVPEAIIVASDTRFTFVRSDRETPGHFDSAVKIWPFSQIKTIVCYSGEAGLAEDCIELFIESYPRDHSPDIMEMSRTLQRILVENWDARRVEDMQLEVLMAVHTGSQAELVKFRSESSFQPMFLYGVAAIGDPRSGTEFQQRLDATLKGHVEAGTVEKVPTSWATIVAGCLYETIESQPPNGGVGGKVLCTILDADGVHGWAVRRTKDGKEFEDLSLHAAEAETYKKKFKVASKTDRIEWKETMNPTGAEPYWTKL